jgi:hypothetical protein
MKRHIALVLLIATLATGCVDSHVGVSDATYKRTSADVVTQLKALPGLTIDTHVESSFETGRGNVFADVTIPLSSPPARMRVVADTIARTVWLSHLDPLGSISINIHVRRQGRNVLVLQRLYQDTSGLLAKYGPRPGGIPG